MAVLESARPEIWQKPIIAKKTKDKKKLCEKANNAIDTANPNELTHMDRTPTRSLFTDASTKAATVAPTPGADMSRPKPDAPTCRTLVAKIGTNRLYGAPNVAIT